MNGATLKERLLIQLARSNKRRAERGYDWHNGKQRAALVGDLKLRKLTEVVLRSEVHTR